MSVGPRAPNTCNSQDTQDPWGAARNETGQMTEPLKGWRDVRWSFPRICARVRWGCQTPGGAGAGPAGVKRTRKGVDRVVFGCCSWGTPATCQGREVPAPGFLAEYKPSPAIWAPLPKVRGEETSSGLPS